MCNQVIIFYSKRQSIIVTPKNVTIKHRTRYIPSILVKWIEVKEQIPRNFKREHSLYNNTNKSCRKLSCFQIKDRVANNY